MCNKTRSSAKYSPISHLCPSLQEDGLKVRAWVSEATLQRKVGNSSRAVELLRRAAKLEPKVIKGAETSSYSSILSCCAAICMLGFGGGE